jgi:hypothetical protein
MKKNRISEASLKENIYVQVKCGDYSYAGESEVEAQTYHSSILLMNKYYLV